MSLDLIEPKKYHQLFLDDGAVDNISGTTRTVHSPKKWGPVITGGIFEAGFPDLNL